MKLSIILPSIRPQNLIKWFESVKNACRNNEFEVIIISPYNIPNEISGQKNITVIHSYCSPTVSFMQGATLARGEFIYNFTDDCLLIQDSLDNAINVFESSYTDKDILNLNYVEGVLDPETLELIKEPRPFPSQYWVAGTYQEYRKPAIHPTWQLAPHFLMKRKYFIELGGLDCNFEYLNYNLHDLAFRAQANGSKVYQSVNTCSLCSHLPNDSGDHGPIDEAHNEGDVPKFNQLYLNQNAVINRISIEYNDWKNHPSVWTRRFNPNNLKLTNE